MMKTEIPQEVKMDNMGPKQGHQGNQRHGPRENRGGGGGGGEMRDRKRGHPNQHQDRRDRERGGPGGYSNDGGDGGPQERNRRGPGGPNYRAEQMRFQQYAGPTHNLPNKMDGEGKKFTGRCRLFIGNLSHEITEEEFRKLFEPYGPISEMYMNPQKGFGFVKLETRANAEAARATLDCTVLKGHTLRVRFASHGAALRLKNLSPMVSNELLEYSFGMFGEIERAIVIVDDRGRPTGEGIVEFARKNKALQALKRISEECFMITSSPRPLIVEPFEQKDDEDGLPDKILPQHTQQFIREREMGPRFAMLNSFEYEFGSKWKNLYEMEKQKRDQLEREIQEDRERLEEQMEFSIYEQETNILREKLRQREMDANNIIRERERRMMEQERQRDEHRVMQEDMIRRRQDLGGQGQGQGRGEGHGGRPEEMRRRHEDNLMMQASQLNNLLDQQEAAMRHISQGEGNTPTDAAANGMASGPGNTPGAGPGPGFDGPPPPPHMGNKQGGGGGGGSGNGGGGGGGGNQGGPGPRQSRFDQPNQGAMGPNGPPGPGSGSGNRGMGPMGPPGSGERGGMGRREMEYRDRRDDYPSDMKRRRY